MAAKQGRRGGMGRMGGRLQLALVLLLLFVSAIAVASGPKWLTIAGDGVHDPAGPAVGLLQEPREALGGLPPDTAGNQVRWMQALEQGQIQPRTNINPETIVNLRTTDVLLTKTSVHPMVRFPHRQHTQWLDCSNCHDHLFEQKAGATPIGMMAILMGQKCGVCHGAVAFPLTECNRCHSVVRGSPEHLQFGGSLVRESAAP
jgi:c(7)-type cytochrome triheme protein